MLGRGPRVPHEVLRWLIIGLLALNGVQLVLLQGAINSSELRQLDTTWTFVAVSAAILLLTGVLIGYAFWRARRPLPGERAGRPAPGNTEENRL